MTKFFFSFVLTVCIGFGAFAQNRGNEAVILYKEGKYAEAAELLEKDLRKAPNSNTTLLLDCYKALKRYDDAEKLLKKQIKRRNDPTLWIDLGYIQQLDKKPEKAEESYQNAIDFIVQNPGLAYNISDQFSKYGLYKKALLSFQTAEAVNPNMVFNYQKGLIYAEMGDVENMYREYLELIAQNPSYFISVKQRISRNITEDPTSEANAILKEQLIKKIQQTQNPLFSELLIWLYTEEMAYDKALRQLKALDKREQNRDKEIYDLGQLALSKEQYFIGRESFEYLVKKGISGTYFQDAVYSELEAKRLELNATPQTKQSDYKALINEHEDALKKLVGDEKYVDTKRNIARLLYFRLHLTDSAIADLQRTISRFETTYKKPTAECKMLLGDILLAENQPVDAIFEYMKVERAYNGTPLGDEAKYMKGMVAYYTADFPWALNQFEVLKSSTTKLISNDALQMALLITDNSVEDTLYQGLTYYAKADLYSFRNLPDSALATLDLLLAVFPTHEIVAEATLFKANLLAKKGDYNEAISTLEKLLKDKNGDIWTDDALMLLGKIYAENIGDKEKAMAAYETILFEHAGSTFVPEARRRYRNLRGDDLH